MIQRIKDFLYYKYEIWFTMLLVCFYLLTCFSIIGYSISKYKSIDSQKNKLDCIYLKDKIICNIPKGLKK